MDLFGLGVGLGGAAAGGCSTEQQFMLRSALGRLLAREERQVREGPVKASTDNADGVGMFAGLLWTCQEMRVYGYRTTTKIAILLVVEDLFADDAPPDNERFRKLRQDEDARKLLARIHRLYVDDAMNPFKAIGSPISSRRFVSGLERCVAAFNRGTN